MEIAPSTDHLTMGYVGHNPLMALGGDYSWQSNQDRYAGDYAWTTTKAGPGTYLPAQTGRNLVGRMPNTPAYYPEGYAGPPIPGFSGGLLPSSAAYEFMPQSTPVYLPQQSMSPQVGATMYSQQSYPVSPVQQLATTYKGGRPEGSMDVGSSVKLKFFSSPEGMLYNGLVGDIVAVTMQKGYNGLPEPVYDVRCPWRDPRTVKKEALEDKEHGHVLHSAFTADRATENRRLLGSRPLDLPSMGGFGGQPVQDCPYILLTNIPKEKLEPLREWEETAPPVAPPIVVPPQPQPMALPQQPMQFSSLPVQQVAPVMSSMPVQSMPRMNPTPANLMPMTGNLGQAPLPLGQDHW